MNEWTWLLHSFSWWPVLSQMNSIDQGGQLGLSCYQLRSTGNGFLEWCVEKNSEAASRVQAKRTYCLIIIAYWKCWVLERLVTCISGGDWFIFIGCLLWDGCWARYWTNKMVGGDILPWESRLRSQVKDVNKQMSGVFLNKSIQYSDKQYFWSLSNHCERGWSRSFLSYRW